MLIIFYVAVERRILLMLEEIKSQNQTQIVLLQQLLSTKSNPADDNDVQDEFGLPLTTLEQLLKLESNCKDGDAKSRLVHNCLKAISVVE